METKNLTLQESILISVVILVVALFGVQYSKQKSIERQQAIKIQAEQKIVEDKKAAEDLERLLLASCVDSADEVYWNYIKLNGTDLGDGKWNAPTYQWDEAQKRKDNKLNECYKLYK